jgi:hypothetical protein
MHEVVPPVEGQLLCNLGKFSAAWKIWHVRPSWSVCLDQISKVVSTLILHKTTCVGQHVGCPRFFRGSTAFWCVYMHIYIHTHALIPSISSYSSSLHPKHSVPSQMTLKRVQMLCNSSLCVHQCIYVCKSALTFCRHTRTPG